LRELQGRPLARGNFNLYSRSGHLYLAAAAAGVLLIGCGLAIVLARDGMPTDTASVVTLAAGGVVMLTMSANLALTYVKHRRIHRMYHARCPHCGYDLRATPDRCPECGTIPPSA
jgi:predicted Zn-ribbon and HTH transcriptional regulator